MLITRNSEGGFRCASNVCQDFSEIAKINDKLNSVINFQITFDVMINLFDNLMRSINSDYYKNS